MNDYLEDNFMGNLLLFTIAVGILGAIYYFVDAMWIHPEQYSSPNTVEDAMWESRDGGEFYAP